MKDETKALLKLHKVIESCETEEHILCTHRLLNYYEKMYKPKSSLTEQWDTFVISSRDLGDALLNKELEIRYNNV